MDPRVAAILNEKKEKEIKRYNKKKEEFLLDLELYDKVYSPDGNYNDEYPFYDWDEETGTSRFHKKVPIQVTDEEYQALRDCTDADTDNHRSNGVATAVFSIAWIIYIGGLIAGLLEFSDSNDAAFENAFALWFDAFVSGTIFLAIGEIVKQLFNINCKLSPEKKAAADEEAEEE